MRYQGLKDNEKNVTVPYIKLDIKPSDKYVVYKEGESRLDNLADEYYEKPEEGWLILLANPEYGGVEWNIPDESVIRIPYPYDITISEYIKKIKETI